MILSFPGKIALGDVPAQGDQVERADGTWLVSARVWRADGSVDCHLHLLRPAPQPEASPTD